MAVDGPKAALGGVQEAETCENHEATQWEELAAMLESKDCRIGCGVKGGRGFKGNSMTRASGDTGGHCLRCRHCSYKYVLREKKPAQLKKYSLHTCTCN